MGIFSDEKYRPSESRILATALTFSAGFIDAYTYIFNGDILYLLGRQETSSSLRQHLLTIILQVC